MEGANVLVEFARAEEGIAVRLLGTTCVDDGCDDDRGDGCDDDRGDGCDDDRGDGCGDDRGVCDHVYLGADGNGAAAWVLLA
jgi:hypothetical protein